MTDQPTDDGFDPALLDAANERLQKARAAQPAAPDPAPLPGVIAKATAAMERRWQRGDIDQDAAARERHDRAVRVTELEDARAQVPEHFRGPRAELAQHMPEKFLRAVDGWNWGDDNLLLLGGTRVGKTTAAAYLLRRLLGLGVHHGGEALEKAKLMRWQSCRDLTYTIRESPLGHGAPDAIVRCQNARLLVLDDIGQTDDKGALERILDVRYQRSWPTITTSGLRYRELVHAFGEALVRRLTETKNHGGRILEVFPKVEAA
jgi:DNA replication protein DnaC